MRLSGGAYMYMFSIHPASLCLLVDAFNPLTFKVVINMYDPITIFLIVLGLFFVGFFLLLWLIPRKVPLAFAVKLVWWCWILTFACLESFWFLHQIWMSLLKQSVLGCRLFHFITLNISCHSLLTCRVSVEKSAGNLKGVPLYVMCHFPLVAFNILSLSLTFVS